jgi:acyl-CoA synthetase (NDP forming)
MPQAQEALQVCEAAGIPVIPWRMVEGPEKLAEIPLRFPLVLKLISRQVSHKSDVGGVIMGINTPTRLKREVLRMAKKFSGFQPEGFLLQETAPKGIELIVGGKRDPSFGPVVMVGLGGIYVEVFRDMSLRLAPVTRREAAEMIEELKSFSLLKGVRGEGPYDVEALVEVICRVSSLMVKCPEITEMDLNPVICHPRGSGVSIVDARLGIGEEMN